MYSVSLIEKETVVDEDEITGSFLYNGLANASEKKENQRNNGCANAHNYVVEMLVWFWNANEGAKCAGTFE
jgi:hypothetical protein